MHGVMWVDEASEEEEDDDDLDDDDDGAAGEDDNEEEEDSLRWHEIQAVPVRDPITGAEVSAG